VSLRPPPGLSAADFFTAWLPDAFASSGAVAAPDAPIVRVNLSGPGGGQWRLHSRDSELVIEPIPATDRGPESAEIWLRQAAADFAATFTPDPDLPELLPASWSALDLLFLDPRDVALARQIAGRILIEIAGRRRRRWALDAAFGAEGIRAGRARATVQIDSTTYEALRGRTMAPMQALLAGKVKIDGDRALAMKALMLTASRLAR
jgi:hypothetical protein